MKRLLFVLFLLAGMRGFAQSIFMATSTNVSFFAGTPVEDIDAINTKAKSFLNITTGEVNISIPNTEFHFKRSLMEEHFNENYMESDKYPKSEFKGKITDVQKIDLKSKEKIVVKVTGILNIHGVTKERTIEVTLHFNENRIDAETKFKIPLEDHNIERPKILWEKIAENVDVTATFVYEPYKK